MLSPGDSMQKSESSRGLQREALILFSTRECQQQRLKSKKPDQRPLLVSVHIKESRAEQLRNFWKEERGVKSMAMLQRFANFSGRYPRYRDLGYLRNQLVVSLSCQHHLAAVMIVAPQPQQAIASGSLVLKKTRGSSAWSVWQHTP